VTAKIDLPDRREEPFRVKKYQPCHKILNDEWERRKASEIDEPITDEKDLCLYKVKNPAENLVFEK
jgi:hypothetical protein